MTVIVNTETGEILDAAVAERRAERITLRLDAIADNYAAVMPMIREAIEQRDDLALGYRSPGEYVADRFGGSLQRLGVEVRRAVVGELTAAGLSTRAIAPVVGVSHMTVQNDVSASGVKDFTPEAASADFPEMPEVLQKAVTGVDGKTYSRPTSRATPRPAAINTLTSIQSLAAKAAREAQTLTADQIRRARAEAGHIEASLRHSIETLTRLADSLTTKENQ